MKWFIVAGVVPLRRVLSDDVTFMGNLTASFSLGLFVIAAAWIFYRPVLGAGLLMASVSPFLYSVMGLYNIAQNNNGYYNR